MDKVYEGKYQLVLISPEALLTNETWRDMLHSSVYQERLVAFVVDEAHCQNNVISSFVCLQFTAYRAIHIRNVTDVFCWPSTNPYTIMLYPLC